MVRVGGDDDRGSNPPPELIFNSKWWWWCMHIGFRYGKAFFPSRASTILVLYISWCLSFIRKRNLFWGPLLSSNTTVGSFGWTPPSKHWQLQNGYSSSLYCGYVTNGLCSQFRYDYMQYSKSLWNKNWDYLPLPVYQYHVDVITY